MVFRAGAQDVFMAITQTGRAVDFAQSSDMNNAG